MATMDFRTNIIQRVNSILAQVKEAKRLLTTIKTEVRELKCEIAESEEISKFQSKHEDESSEGSVVTHEEDEEDDGPPVKRIRSDFNTADGYVVVYVDGACENNGRPNAKAGIGVWFGDTNSHNISKPVIGRATNNVAEIQACIAALGVAKENGIKKLRIITDSQFCINAITKWVPGWKKKGWKLADGKTDVKNKVDFQELDMIRSGIQVDWVHVSGHSGVHGNDMADKLAREGAQSYSDQVTVTLVLGREKNLPKM